MIFQLILILRSVVFRILSFKKEIATQTRLKSLIAWLKHIDEILQKQLFTYHKKIKLLQKHNK